MVAGPRNQIVRFCTPNYDFPRFPALDGAALDVVAPRSGSPKEGEPPAADTISGYIQGLLDGIEFKQTAYPLDRDSRKAALPRFL
ncbi:hypothetical protein M2222_005111 [Bradyrhizobium elkanii]|jgi:hypothetical protein|nr:hypothetical protein [Bradyrhizobium elkanii]MCS3562789.1 hypothetical protein [Bradyrhizobium elkanii]MCW2147375.1 hypothetical protein [Bradyrhizobium elkanii]MCW2353543.1 hypothetical protein [Bradyrhizobium elkanii]MCW2371101.1 hypothetical protein [Bradyrhizobium elkanii]